MLIELSNRSPRRNIRRPSLVNVLGILLDVAHRSNVLGDTPSIPAACVSVRSWASSPPDGIDAPEQRAPNQDGA